MSTVEQAVGKRQAIGGKPLHSEWQRRLRKLNWRGLSAVAGFFVIWEVLVRFELAGFGSIPSPIEVTATFFSEYLPDAGYWYSWWASFERVLYGFAAAQLIGIPLGLFLGTSRTFNHLFYPVIEVLRPIPPLAWVPLSILFWPTTELSIVFICFIGPFFIIVINIHDAIKGVKKEHLWLAMSLGASSGQIFRRVILPSVIPSIAVGMTLGIAVTWNVVIAAEMIASDSGLGRLTWEGYVSHTGPVVVIGMISIGIAGYLSTLIVDWVEKRMMPWKNAG
jgi:NitT/TauT family transport system permease protein